jgi:ADP-ribosylglycohydrolase
MGYMKTETEIEKVTRLAGRLAGSLVGTAVGDALGLPGEGLSAGRIGRMWGGEWKMRLVMGRGMVSDDTEHTWCVLGALAEGRGDVKGFGRALGWRLRWWFLALPAGVGMATARACIRLWCGWSPERSGVWSAGNGPAMRSAVIGVYFCEDEEKRREYVRVSTRVTHTDPKAEVAAQAVALAAAAAVRGDGPGEVVRALRELSEDAGWREIVRVMEGCLAEGKSTGELAAAMGLEKGVSGYAWHSVPVALYAWLRHPDDFATALTSALDCGGDTDTVGAIVGGIAGARVGVAAIPAAWREGIVDWPINVAVLRDGAERVASGERLPGILWPMRVVRNLVFLVVVLGHGIRRMLPPY